MTQLSFSIRTTTACKTVHLLGSWDGYAGQLPMARPSSKRPDAWEGTFRFNSAALKDGERYWYYYILDGYHVAHDPACESTVEPKTGRRLNLLVLKNGVALKSKTVAASTGKSKTTSSTSGKAGSKGQTIAARRHARNASQSAAGGSDVPRGRPLSPSQIKAPQPMKPHGVASPRTASAISAAAVSEHGSATVAHLATQLGRVALAEHEGVDWDEWSSSASSCGRSSASLSDCESDSTAESSDYASSALSSSRVSAASSRTSAASTSPPVAVAVTTASGCVCARFATTRSGARVRLDCGGTRCGRAQDGMVSPDSGSCASESSSESDDEFDSDSE